MSAAAASTSTHTLTLHVQGAKTWLDVEQLAADAIARYFSIPRRGRDAESIEELLSGALVEAELSDDGLFKAKLQVTRG